MKPYILILLALIFPWMNIELSSTGIKENPTESVADFPNINPVNLEGRMLRVVASTSVIGDVASNLVGKRVQLTVLMGREQSPHSYYPSPKDVISLEEADMIFVNGFGLEERLLSILEGMENIPVLPVSWGIPHTEDDPHIWLSPLNIVTWVDNMERALVLSDSEGKNEYKKIAEEYRKGLLELHEEVKTMVSILPLTQRKLVTDHSFMTYYAKDYGFEIVGHLIASVSDHAEPSARALTELVAKVQSENVRVLFVGETANPDIVKMAKIVAQETDRNLPIVQLLSDALSTRGSRGDSYFDFIRYNTEQITSALSEK